MKISSIFKSFLILFTSRGIFFQSLFANLAFFIQFTSFYYHSYRIISDNYVIITMDHVYSTTTKHEKGKHLSYDERVLIQIRLKDGWSANKIAKEIGCAPNTVRNEIRRGTVSLYTGCCQSRIVMQTLWWEPLMIFKKHIASISVKCSRQSRQTASWYGFLVINAQLIIAIYEND